MTADSEPVSIPSTRLIPGIYVDLELNWMRHPFPFTRFRVSTQKQIEVIRTLKPRAIRIDPSRCDPEALRAVLDKAGAAEPAGGEDEPGPVDPEVQRQLQKKAAQKERARRLSVRRREITRLYQQKARQIRSIALGMRLQPANAIHDVDELVEDLAQRFESGDNLLARLVDLNADHYEDYNHVANVTMLSLMLASAEGYRGQRLRSLATGAVLHDIGKVVLPDAILRKEGPLTPSEQAVLQEHPRSGLRLVRRVRQLDADATAIIGLHHEYLDGSGYPDGRSGDAIPPQVRIVTIANHYDNLCNPRDPDTALTPKEALATLYRDYGTRLERRLVERLIDVLGVYPPGTVVLLDNDAIGLVVSASGSNKLTPDVLLYDPEQPREEALILSLADYPDVRIARALRRGDYPDTIHDYFGIREQIGYMVDRELDS